MDGWYLVLVLGDPVTREEHLRDEHLVGDVPFARLLEGVLEPALHAVTHHLRQRLPLALGCTDSISSLHGFLPRVNNFVAGSGGGGEGFGLSGGFLQPSAAAAGGLGKRKEKGEGGRRGARRGKYK